MQALGMINNIKSHLGYELFPGFFSKRPFKYLVSATNHSLHHTQYKGNYGLFFRFWDIWCGTELNTTQALFDEIHERKDVVIIDNTVYQTLTIDNLVKENSDTMSVYFKPNQKQFYTYEAGQYLTIKVSINGKVHHRCFSLSSSPEVDNFLRITVKLNGVVSHYFYNDAVVGDTIESLLPVGNFVLKPAVAYTMIAGGSGITPLFSMIRQLLYRDPHCHITLFYANKSPDTIIFGQELQILVEQYKHFHYQDFFSGQSRIGKNDLTDLVGSSFYICGPDSLKDTMHSYLTELNVDPAMIHIEHYADGYVPWFGLFA
jgi:ring-1,2-phenylacetyl-CoA epoxidase subunit PaaE